MKDLYALFAKRGLAGLEDIHSFCYEKNIEEIIEFAAECLAITNTARDDLAPSLFNFSASITLSGGNFPCESVDCRIKNIENIAKFSAAYSDSTTIHNPYDFIYYYIEEDKKLTESSEDKIREYTFIAVVASLQLRALIESGIIRFSKTLYTLCEPHKKEHDEETDKIHARLMLISERKVFPKIQKQVKLKYESQSIHLDGIEDLIGETVYLQYKVFPRFMTNKKGKKITNIQEMKFSNPMIQNVINKAINSLMMQKVSSLQKISKTYITSNSIERMLLENVDEKSDERAIKLLLNGLPVINTNSFGKILSVREKNKNEFKAFQNKISELLIKGREFKEQSEFNTYVLENIESELIDIKKIQNDGRKEIMMKSLIHGGLLGASIHIATATNFESGAVLGLMDIMYGCHEVANANKRLNKEIKNIPTYFYYRLSEQK
jgi:hypothetical protein